MGIGAGAGLALLTNSILFEPGAIFVVHFLNVVGKPIAQKGQQLKVHSHFAALVAGG